MIKNTFFLIPVLAAFCSQAFADESTFTLKDNDTWVMAGDSITAQRLHSNYIEAFYRTRYPKWHLHFRNSGVSGNRVGDALARFDYDVAAWKPTIVSVELGMNDVCVPNPDSKEASAGYADGMKKLASNIRAIQAQPLFISSSPVNDGSLMGAWLPGRCRPIHPFTEALKELGQSKKIKVIDQYHPLIDLWGPNQTLEDVQVITARIRVLKPESNMPGLETLQAFAKAWEGKPTGISLGGDGIHPGPVGQYTMAATILKALNVDREVSSATLRPDGTVLAARGCNITEITTQSRKLSFTRLDQRSPWPLLSAAAPAVKLMPEIADLSRYTLTIPGLAAGHYRVSMNEAPVATLSAEELAKGWNMSTVVEGPLGQRATNILSLIDQLQGPLNLAWREASKEKDSEKLAAAQKAIDECEAKVQDACQPASIRFVIERIR